MPRPKSRRGGRVKQRKKEAMDIDDNGSFPRFPIFFCSYDISISVVPMLI